MVEPKPPREASNWGTWVIEQVVHPLAVFLPPAFLVLLMGYFVLAAFDTGLAAGLRSLSAVLLPLSLVTFLFLFQREWLSRVGDLPPVVGFAVALLVGMAIMAAASLYERGTALPLTELVFSVSFSLLVFSHASLRAARVSVYSYGMMSGLLLYIIIFGFPVLR